MHQIISDFTVIGGGIAGITAALCAARKGMKVALIHDRSVLGGNHSSECRVHLSSSAERGYGYYNRETGVCDEMKLSILHNNPRYNQKLDYDLTDMSLYSMVIEEQNIRLFQNTLAYEVEKQGATITKVFAHNVFTQERYVFESPLFADASGNGIVALKAGATYSVGREAESTFQETYAPKTADSHVMGSCILFTVGVAQKPVPFVKPSFAYDYKKDGILQWVNRPQTGRVLPKELKTVDGIWWLSYGGDLDTIKDHDQINHELKKLVYGFWDYVKNSGDYEQTDNLFINWIAPFPAMRESRRFMGEYVMTEHDLFSKTTFHDAIATGGWSIDIHDVHGVYGNDVTSKFGMIEQQYNIPYRITVAKDLDNLFLCGRIISASHVALGSMRIMQTLSAVAQSTGNAAAICKSKGILPRDIAKKENMALLQDALQQQGVYILGRQEDVGFAKDAVITGESLPLSNDQKGKYLPLEKDVMLVLPIACLESLEFKLKATANTTVEIEVYQGDSAYTYLPKQKIATTALSLSENFEDWCKVTFTDAKLSNPSVQRMYLVLKANADASVYCTWEQRVGAPSFYYNDGAPKRLYKKHNRYHVEYNHIAFRSVLPHSEVYGVSNLVSGYDRPTHTPNIWMNDKQANCTLCFTFEKAVPLKKLQLVMNAELEKDHFNAPVASLLKDYDILLLADGKETKIEVRDNYLGRNEHILDLEQVQQVQITCLDNYGADCLSLYSVKMF